MFRTVGTFKSIDAATKGFPQRFGNYELLAKLATGGMGEVFLARQCDASGGFQKLVVLKRVLPHLMDQPRFVRMFQHEARIAARINHTNVCQTFELGSAEGMYYMTMEYLEGVPLNHVIKRRKRDRRLGDLRLMGRFITQAAEGLHAAHELRDERGELVGVVHRDVCHSNIFVTSTGVAKLLDFGVAKARGAMEKTRTGVVKGTYAYSAPEQLRGEDVDRRADVFGLGIVAWEATTGRRLFRRETDFLVFRAITEEPIPSPLDVRPDTPPELAAVIERALSRDRDRRFASARELGAAIGEALQSLGPPLSSVAVASLLETSFSEELQEQRKLCGFVEDDTETVDLPLGSSRRSDRYTDPTITKPFESRDIQRLVGALPLPADTDQIPALEDDGDDDQFPDFEVTPLDDGIGYSAMTPMPQPFTRLPTAKDEPPLIENEPTDVESEPGEDTGQLRDTVQDMSPLRNARPLSEEADMLTEAVSPIEPASRSRLVWALVLACVLAVGAVGFLLVRGGGDEAESGATAVAPADAAAVATAPVAPADAAPPAVEVAPSGPADAGAEVAVAAAPPDAAPEVVAEIEPAEVVERPDPKPRVHRKPRRPRKPPKQPKPGRDEPSDPGYLTIDADPYATVWIDGKKVGVTPVVRAELSAGSHEVRAVSSAGGAVKRFKVKVQSGKSTRKKINW